MNFYRPAFLWFIPIISGLLFQFSFVSPIPDSHPKQNRNKPGVTNIVFKSADGGQTWQDISEGLPENGEEAGSFADATGLYLRDRNGIYHAQSNAAAPSWKKERFLLPGNPESIAPGKAGIFAYNTNGNFLQQTKGTGVWQPVYRNFPGKEVRTIFETARGTVFIPTGFWTSSSRLYKSTDNGKTWKPLLAGALVMKIVESDGVLLATGLKGILRSTDEGETWETVISEGGLGMDVERIKGGFAAITFNSASRTSRVRTSYDAGKTWQPIDAGLPADYSISSITQVGNNLFCCHANGLFRSSDKGKTWKVLLPAAEGKVLNLYVSGNVIYAISRKKGC
jgi:photosystem II stability/assembly factor-like uncharacterized protein